MSFELTLQEAIFSALSANAAIVQKRITVRADDSGASREYPYIVVGDDELQNWDTDTELGGDSNVTIHVWSRQPGKKETKEIQGLIYDALHDVELMAAGYKFLPCDWVSSKSFLDADGKTRHGVQVFKVFLEKL